MVQPLGYQALRRGRISVPGQCYLLTTVTANRRPLFRQVEHARAVCRSTYESHCWGDAELLCWVLMPDHWHGVVRLGARDDLALVMNRFKSVAAKSLQCTQTALVWGRGFHDRALRREEELRSVARYVVANPLRAGLVTNVLNYPYWDCVWL